MQSRNRSRRWYRAGVILTLICILCRLNVYAASIADVDINNLSREKLGVIMGTLINHATTHDITSAARYKQMFTPDCYDKWIQYVESNDISGKEELAYTSEIVVDYTKPSQSSTGDTVVMVNIKEQYDNWRYNKLYLFEFHVNIDGDIYGYNVWQY